MRVLTDLNQHSRLIARISRDIIEGKGLPEKVFVSEISHFAFLTFDELFMEEFYAKLTKFITGEGAVHMYFSVLDPDPVGYFFQNFRFYGTIEFSVDDDAKVFSKVVCNYPEHSPADSMAHNSNIVTVHSELVDLAIYADRNFDVIVCGFRERSALERFRREFSGDLIDDATGAAEYAFGNDEIDSKDKMEFVRSYS